MGDTMESVLQILNMAMDTMESAQQTQKRLMDMGIMESAQQTQKKHMDMGIMESAQQTQKKLMDMDIMESAQQTQKLMDMDIMVSGQLSHMAMVDTMARDQLSHMDMDYNQVNLLNKPNTMMYNIHLTHCSLFVNKSKILITTKINIPFITMP